MTGFNPGPQPLPAAGSGDGIFSNIWGSDNHHHSMLIQQQQPAAGIAGANQIHAPAAMFVGPASGSFDPMSQHATANHAHASSSAFSTGQEHFAGRVFNMPSSSTKAHGLHPYGSSSGNQQQGTSMHGGHVPTINTAHNAHFYGSNSGAEQRSNSMHGPWSDHVPTAGDRVALYGSSSAIQQRSTSMHGPWSDHVPTVGNSGPLYSSSSSSSSVAEQHSRSMHGDHVPTVGNSGPLRVRYGSSSANAVQQHNTNSWQVYRFASTAEDEATTAAGAALLAQDMAAQQESATAATLVELEGMQHWHHTVVHCLVCRQILRR
jgi:hypothetical protein